MRFTASAARVHAVNPIGFSRENPGLESTRLHALYENLNVAKHQSLALVGKATFSPICRLIFVLDGRTICNMIRLYDACRESGKSRIDPFARNIPCLVHLHAFHSDKRYEEV